MGEGNIVDFLPTEIFPGIIVNIQTIFMSWITMALVFTLVFLASRNLKLIPGTFQLIIEGLVGALADTVEENLGKKGRQMITPFFICLFLYIFLGNELGLIPQILMPFHLHITSPTADLNTTFALAISVILGVNVAGAVNLGPKFFKHYIQPSPIMLPINLVDELAKTVTLAFRLFGNIVAGEILLTVLNNLAPVIAPLLWIVFSLAIGLLQAVIFSVLSICYMQSAFSEH